MCFAKDTRSGALREEAANEIDKTPASVTEGENNSQYSDLGKHYPACGSDF